MPVTEKLRSLTELLPEVKHPRDLLAESNQLQSIGSRAANGAMGLGLVRKGYPAREVKNLIQEGYEFLREDLKKDLKIIKEGFKFPILERVEKKYDPEKIISEAFPGYVKPGKKITGKQIEKILLEIGGWEKTLQKLTKDQAKPVSDKNLEMAQAGLASVGQAYLDRARDTLNQYSIDVSPSKTLFAVKKK